MATRAFPLVKEVRAYTTDDSKGDQGVYQIMVLGG